MALLAFELAACTAVVSPGHSASQWQRTRHRLYNAGSTSLIGECTASALGAWPRDVFTAGSPVAFDFGEGGLVVNEIPYAGAGVGHQVWPAAVALALFMRGACGRALIEQADASCIEVGAGLGLPGLDIARRGAARRVCLTDKREALVSALDVAVAALDSVAKVSVKPLDWMDLAAHNPGEHELVIGSDICYYDPDVLPLADALQSLTARVSLIAAPLHREAVRRLEEVLTARGATVVNHMLVMVSDDVSAAAGDDDRADGVASAAQQCLTYLHDVSFAPDARQFTRPPVAKTAPLGAGGGHTASYRVLEVSWPQLPTPRGEGALTIR